MGAEIRVHVGGASILAELTKPDIPVELDTVFLRLKTPVGLEHTFPLVASFLPRGLTWETFGFPRIRGHVGMPLRGVIDRSLYTAETPRDVELTCEGADLPSDFRGFSGAPVIVAGTIRAMLQRRLDGGLGAISLARLQSYLDAVNLNFRSARDHEELPPALERELASTIPNNRTLWQIEEAVARRRHGYLVLTGHPGAGKTLVTASFQPSTDEIRVVGRYFAGGFPGNDLPPTHYRRLAPFALWLSGEAILRSTEATAVQSDASVTALTESIANNLNAIAATFKDGELGVLFIDGVDPAATDASPTFVDSLPPDVPTHLVIVITTQDCGTLATRFAHLQLSDTISTTPLPLYDCEWLVTKELGETLLPSQAAYVAELSQGHPLTLKYFINELQNAIAQGADEPLTVLDGGPDDYYLRLWNRFATEGFVHYLLALIARLRGAITETELFHILPPDQRFDFSSSLAKIRHLLRVEDNAIRFYHESFRDFVHSQTAMWDEQIHVALAKYCHTEVNSEYATANVLNHHLLAFDESASASRLCTQDWLDRAASFCVHPEFVLLDVEEVLRRQMDAGDVTDTIRLLLLRSRVHYRYNHVFLLFAADFARATLSLRGPAQALRFIVRNDRYICSIDDAVAILRRLSLGMHRLHAMQLFRDLRMRLWAAYETGAADYSSLRSHMLATCIVAPCSDDDPRATIVELRRLSRLLTYNLKRSEPDRTERRRYRSSIWGSLGGYLLWRTGYAPSQGVDALELAMILESADSMAQEEGFTPPHVDLPGVSDTVPLLDRDQIGHALRKSVRESHVLAETETLVARSLMRVSGEFSLVGDLFKRAFPVATEAPLRTENGVDANVTSIEQVRFANESHAFTGDSSIADRIVPRTRHSWENRFFEAAAWLGRTSGSRYRYRSLGQRPELSLIDELRLSFFPRIRFSLKERSEWEDAYHIPENVVPRLVFYAAEVVAEFEPESSAQLASLIIDHEECQFGLYTEGYQRVLAVAADVVATTGVGERPAADLRRCLLRHLTTSVFSRQERVSGLLNCAQHLAVLGAKEDADFAFQEAIASSLGPSWYKEGQFGLLLDAVQAVGDRDFALSQWRKTVEVLAYASGEATFQRFVRQQKEQVIRHLSRHGLFSEALATYWHYAFPSLALQKSRITRVGVDKASDLASNRTGVQEVDEQGGVVALLSGLNKASPLRRWAVVELFWPWGDDRYAQEFVEELCELLKTSYCQAVGDRFLRLLRTEVSPDRRQRFARSIVEHDVSGVAAPWLARATELGILEVLGQEASESFHPDMSQSSERDTATLPARDEEDVAMPGVFGRRQSLRSLETANQLAEERIKRHDVESARLVLRDGLLQAQGDGWNIWEGLTEADVALNQLLTGFGSMKEGLRTLTECVMAEAHESDWRIARKLMMIAMSHADADGRRNLFSIVADHIECLVRPERRQYSVCDELKALEKVSCDITPDECVDRLLMSLIDHPNKEMRSRAAITVEWLVREKVLDARVVVDRVVSREVGDGREIAIGILQRIISDDPTRAGAIISPEQLETLRSDPHVLVRDFVERCLGTTWVKVDAIHADSPLAQARAPTEWSFDTAQLFGLLAGSRETAESLAGELCKPLTPKEMVELQDIRRKACDGARSFRGHAFERESVFRSLCDITDDAGRQAVLSSSLWNPLWPDRQLLVDASPLFPGIMARLEANELSAAFNLGPNTILHCFEFRPPEGGESSQTDEAVAVLVCKEYFEGHLDFDNLWEVGSVHSVMSSTVRASSILASSQNPAVIRFEPENRIGGNFTPAFPCATLSDMVGSGGVERVCWRDGRRWDLWGPGPPLAGGTALLLESSRVQRLVGYDVVWVILRNNVPTRIVDVRRGRVYRGNDED
jgi:hypothetical protein